MTNNIQRKIVKIDATDQTVGRLSTKIAFILRGKDKPEWQPHIDSGDIVEVSNADKLRFTSKKFIQREYYHHSGHPGGLKTQKMSTIFSRNPGELLHRSVRDMLPATRLRNNMLKRLIIK